MNNERYNQIIDEAYENYKNYMQENYMETRWNKVLEIYANGSSGRRFYTECKTDPEFSERWGLKIEERELSGDERYDWYIQTHNKNLTRSSNQFDMDDILNSNNCPTKLITITYKDEKIEVYE
jgi:hypothetical protein